VDNREPQEIIDEAKKLFGHVKVKQLASGDIMWKCSSGT
jgi:hypothetical protein